MPLVPEKDLKKYYSISEVAKIFSVTETLLRYWEKCFPTIAPRKCGRNVRQYCAEDIEEIRVVYNLVKVRGMRITAAREALEKNREGVTNTARIMDRLQRIRAELAAMRKELEHL